MEQGADQVNLKRPPLCGKLNDEEHDKKSECRLMLKPWHTLVGNVRSEFAQIETELDTPARGVFFGKESLLQLFSVSFGFWFSFLALLASGTRRAQCWCWFGAPGGGSPPLDIFFFIFTLWIDLFDNPGIRVNGYMSGR